MAATMTTFTQAPPALHFQEAEALTQKFNQLAAAWRRETALKSSVTAIAMHPAYQQIIGMGEQALPLIFHQLQTEPDHWFWALQAITGENPVPDENAGDLEAMAKDWLDWGKRHNYL